MNNCCNNSKVQLQKTLQEGYLEILDNGLNNGEIILEPGAFKDGVCSFLGVPQ